MKIQDSLAKIPLILSILFLALSCCAFFFFHREINIKNKELQSREEEWQSEVNRRVEIKALDNSIKIITAERELLETHFAHGSDIVPFLDTIEGLARKVGIRAEIATVDIPVDGSSLVVVLRAPGSFASVYKFITLLENSPYELEF